jgi:hypothetical protein
MKYIFLPALIAVLFIYSGCGEEINAPQDFVSGTITFNDSNLNYNGRYYAVSLFTDVSNPFSRQPVRSDSLAIVTSNGVTSAYYRITGIPSGNYYIGATLLNSSTDSLIAVLGVYGCDTTVNCANPTRVTVPNFAGTGNLNFRSKTN